MKPTLQSHVFHWWSLQWGFTFVFGACKNDHEQSGCCHLAAHRWLGAVKLWSSTALCTSGVSSWWSKQMHCIAYLEQGGIIHKEHTNSAKWQFNTPCFLSLLYEYGFNHQKASSSKKRSSGNILNVLTFKFQGLTSLGWLWKIYQSW